MYIIAGVGASRRGHTPPYFRPKGLPVGQEAYIKTANDNYSPLTMALYSDSDFSSQHDGASSRTDKESANAIEKIFGKTKVLP